MDFARNYGMGAAAAVVDSPIALDLNGDGLASTALADSAAFFDMDMDGFRENVEWLSSNDGFLAMDNNGNGLIDDRTELFGDTEGFANGWDKLATLDTNADGVIDANDAAWSDLLVWRDLDGDGYTDDGELFTMDDLGITSIDLAYDDSLTSSFTLADGTTREATDLHLEQDQMLTIYGDDVDIDLGALLLPWLRGYGEVADLPIAMSLDTDLKAMVADMAELDDADALHAAVDDLLAKWAGVDDIAPETMRGEYSALKLAVMEKFFGTEYYQESDDSPDPHYAAVPFLDKAYESIHNHMFSIFGFQSLLEGTIEGATYDILQDAVVFDLSGRELALELVDLIPTLTSSQVKVLGSILEYSGSVNDLDLPTMYGLVSQDTMQNLLSYVSSANIIGSDTADGLESAAGEENLLWAFAGDDTLYGYDGADTLAGGTGDDHLDGGTGGDTYLINLGDGNDTIEDCGSLYLTDANDVIRFGAGINPADIAFSVVGGSDLVILIGDGQQVRIANQIDGLSTRIERFIFDDGTEWTYDDLLAQDFLFVGTEAEDTIYGLDATSEVIQGREGDDQLHGCNGADTLDGGAGDDYLDGGTGGDTYLINLGDGNDTIEDCGSPYLTDGDDVIRFGVGINPGDIALSVAGGTDLVILIGDGQQVRITNQIDGSSTRIERFIFDDGTEWTYDDLLAQDFLFVGTEADDTLYGQDATSEVMQGLEGNDELYGYGNADTLDGGIGDDYLDGGTGSDIYLINLGDGNDTIVDSGSLSQNDADDAIHFGAGITTDDISLSVADETDLILSIGDDQQLRISYQITDESSRIEHFVFDDGTEWTYDDLLAQGIQLHGTEANDALYGLDDAPDAMQGLEGNDEIYGYGDADTLDGGAGDDYLDGGTGGDTYLINLGDGDDIIADAGSLSLDDGDDVVRFGAGITTDDITLSVVDDTDLLMLIGDDQQLRITYQMDAGSMRIERFIFDDGTEWTHDDLLAQGLQICGTGGNDALYGLDATSDVMQGLDGNDELYGYGGDDTLIGGAGADYLDGGSGSDVYLYESVSECGDGIADWESGIDSFRFNASFFDATSTFTSFSSDGLEYDGSNALLGHNGSAFVYDSSTQKLWYDTNGDEAGGKTLVAEIYGGSSEMVATDIDFI